MISLATVSKLYGKGSQSFQALSNVSCEIERGTSIAIVGKSGSGKSTLMHIMSGLDRASSGTIKVDGVDISLLRDKALDQFRAEKIGFIFQAFFIQANETCYDNVSLALEIAGVKGITRRRRIREALAAVDLEDKIEEKAGNLSGGQKQRLAIARAIVGRPSIIFADEPTGNLDSKTGDMIEKLLFRLNKERSVTLVIVTHDEDLARKCDSQILMRDGKLIRSKTRARKQPVKREVSV